MDISDIFHNESLLTALKWIATILVAGFIGQFGRKFAEHLIDRGKQRRAARLQKNNKKEVKAPSSNENTPESEPEITVTSTPAESLSGSSTARQPEPKIQVIPPGEESSHRKVVSSEPALTADVIEEMAKAKKKADKALAKVEKKHLKAEKKKLKETEQ